MNLHDHVKTAYRRDLPHIQPIGGTFFVTYRLKDTLPRAVAEQFKYEKQLRYRQLRETEDETLKQRLYKEQKRQFARYDNFLDRCVCGECWLQRPEIAAETANSLRFWAGKLYELIAYTVMPNHVHAVMDLSIQDIDSSLDAPSLFDKGEPVEYRQLYQVLKSVKNFTARKSNELLNRSGSFWQKESYDHLVRDGKELNRIIHYVLENPVKAGLVKRWENWPFTFVHPNYFHF
jgi:REP element-mobilizing transposase RayT